MKVEGTPKEIRDLVKNEGMNLRQYLKKPSGRIGSLNDWVERNPYKVIISSFCLGATAAAAVFVRGYVPYQLYDLKEQLSNCQKHAVSVVNQTAPTPVPERSGIPLPVLSETHSASETGPGPGVNGDLGMTLEELQLKYQSLKDRFAEQEALVAKSDRKRVHWRVSVLHVENCGETVCMTFAAKDGEKLPSWSAHFLGALKERIYALHPGDLIEIDGVLKANAGLNYLEVEATEFDVILQ